ncbi:hypothetical protein CFC21_067917 [Triticum aestivum]|uniref:Uncharacterized protein n=3 Tax=Triticum TaxID=4564 RepID=A0A9R0TZF5_TRITD|nr:uncharacterized protein LOC123105220 [Triticum aestivum]KAF7061204.1 hypothetical protein CFC21_067917 [Triticum aestivum]VAI22575.1 unnamed protein product [Triticum turgidum subsp. durum]
MAGGSSSSSSSSWGPSPAAVTALVALLGLGVAAYIVGPPLYWHVAEALGRSPGGCPACACDCDALPLLQLPEDCAKQFKEVKSRASGEETEKSITEMLIEELKQREEEATEAQQQADVKLLEAKKLASQYQKEADKCSSGMDTCEEAREKSAESLLGQRKLTALWEERARELGWKPGNDKPHQNQ